MDYFTTLPTICASKDYIYPNPTVLMRFLVPERLFLVSERFFMVPDGIFLDTGPIH